MKLKRIAGNPAPETLNFGGHLSKTREATVNIVVFGSLRCTWKCILTHSVAHDGLARVRNTNISALASENMWYQNILIELLSVLLLLQSHIHISYCYSLHSSKHKKDS
jgi:hypothetical protein